MSFFSKKEQKKNKLDDTSMDDDLDFDFSSMDTEFSIDEKSRTPIQRVASGIKSSVKSTASNPGTYKKLMLKALPDEYTQVHDELENKFSKLTTATSDAVDKLRPELKTLANKVDKLIPENQRILRKIYDKTLGKHKEEEYSSSERADIQQEQITNALNEVFNKQNEVSLQMQARKAAEDGIKNKTEHNRFLANFQVMSNVDANLSAIRNYQDTVTQAYQKKSLELQYRSYFVQAETLKAIRDHAVASRAENKSIVKNTALPDFAKITSYEKVKDVFSTKFSEKLHQGIFGNSFVENITKSITSKITEITDSIKMGIGSIDMASGMVDDKYEAAGGMVGDGIATMVSDYGSKKLQKLIEKDPVRYKKVLTAGKKAMNVVSGNTDAYAERFANEKLKPDYLSENGIKESAKELLADLIRGALAGPSLQMESMKNASMDKDGIFKPSVFTDKAHTSITEVIPGYLSRMLRELTIIRTGDASAPTQMFDYKSNKFSTSTAIAKQYKDKLLQSTGKDSYVGRNISSVSKDIAGNAPEETKAELDKFVGDITTSRMVYDSEGIRGSKAYANLSPSARQSVDNYLQQMEQDELLKAQFESRLSNIKNSYGDPRKDVEEGLKLGHGDILESLGLVTKDKDNLYKLDMDTYRNISAKGLEVKTPGGEKVSKPIFNQIQDPIDRQAPAQAGSITATVDLSSLIENDNTNASNLLNKIDELTNVVKNLKITVGGGHKSSYEGMSDAISGGYAAFKEKLASLKIPDSVKEYYERAVLTGKMTAEKAQEEIDKLSKKTKFKDMTIGQMGSKALDGIKRAGGFAIDTGMKTANAAWKSTKWLGAKAAETAKAAKDPVFNAMSKIFTTMVNFSKSAIDIGKDFLFNKLPSGFKSVKGVITSAAKTINNYVVSRDVYVAGEDTPRLYARLLRNGFYRLQKDNKVIYSFKDINGPVVDSEGNVIISAEDVQKGLVDKEGKPLQTAFEKTTKFLLEAGKKGIDTTIAITKGIATGVKKAATGTANFFKRGFGVNTLAGNYGGSSGGDSASVVNVLTQIKNILLFRFNMKDSDIPSSEETIETGTPTENNSSGSSINTSAGGSGIFSKIRNKASGGLDKVKGLFNRGRGKATEAANGIRTKIPGGKGLLGKLSNLKNRVLGGIGGFFSKKDSTEQPEDQQSEKTTNKQPETKSDSGKNMAYKELTDVKQKNSYKARLAKLDEEAKNRHKFKQTEVKSRYGEKGGFALLGDMFNFVKNMFSVDGITNLIGGALGKVPLLGGALKSIVGIAGKLGGGLLKGGLSLATKLGPGVKALGALGARGALTAAVTTGGAFLSTAASAAGVAASAAGTAAMGVLGAVGSVLASPVVLTTLGVAAVGFGTYKLFKAFTKNDLNDLEKIRYMQYGFNLDDKGHTKHIHRIRELENFLMKKGISISDGKVSLNKLDTKEFLEAIELDATTEEGKKETEIFMSWFVKRFKPFFLKHCLAIYKADPKLKLVHIKKLDKESKVTYLTEVAKDLDEPYSYTVPPFKGMETLTNNKALVKDAIDEQIEKATKVGTMQKIGNAIGATAKQILGGIKSSVSDAYNSAKGKVSDLYNQAKEGISTVFNKVGAGLSMIGGGIKDSIMASIEKNETIQGALKLFDKVKEKLSPILSSIKNIINQATPLALLAMSPIAYGAYAIYKKLTEDNLDKFERIRFLQYGFNLHNKEHIGIVHLIKQLEDYLLKKGVDITEDSISLKGDPKAEVLLSAVGLNADHNKEEAEIFMAWFTARFKPFFLKHCAAVYNANPKLTLRSINKLTNEELKIYLESISKDLDAPYKHTASPFKYLPSLVDNRELVKANIDKLLLELKSGERKTASLKQETAKLKSDINTKLNEEAKLAAQEAKAAAEAAEKAKKEKEAKQAATTEPLKTETKPVDAVKPPNSGKMSDLPVAGKNDTGGPAEGDGKEIKATNVNKSDTNIPISNELRVAGGGLKDGRNAMQYITLNKPNIDIQNLDPVVKATLFGMIEEYGELTGKKVVITDGFRSRAEQERLHRANPKKAAPPGRSLHEFGIAVDMDRNSYNEMESLGLMRKYGFTRPVGGEPWHAEPAGIQTDINRAKQDPNFRQMAVQAGLFKGGGGYGTDPSATKYRRNNKLAMSLLQQDGKAIDPSAIVTAAKGEDKPSGIAPAGKASTLASTTPSSTNTASTSPSKSPMANTSVMGEGGAKTTSTPGTQSNTNPTEWNRIDTGSNAKVYTDTPSDIPKTMPSGFTNVKAKPEVVAAITDASQKIGVDPSKLMTMAAVESGLNPNAKAKTSSAKGLFQFINSTWKAVAPKVGLAPNADPLNPMNNALAGAKYVKDNEIALSKAGVKPGLLETYLAHFLGAGDARTFLKADDSAIAAEVTPKAANANKAIFYTNGKPNTVGQVKQLLAKKLSTRAKEFGVPTDPSLANVGNTSGGGTTAASSTGGTEGAVSSSTGPDTGVGVSDASTGGAASGSVAPSSMYSKPTIPLGDEPMTAPVKQSTSNAGQENYSKLISDSVSTSLGYQKSMVEHLASIDTNLIKALQDIISLGKQGATAPSSTGSNRSSKENLAPTIDMSRKKAIAT